MASLKNCMPSELFGKEFRGRKFKGFDDMLESTKLFLADRHVAPVKPSSSTPKGKHEDGNL